MARMVHIECVYLACTCVQRVVNQATGRLLD